MSLIGKIRRRIRIVIQVTHEEVKKKKISPKHGDKEKRKYFLKTGN